ncbi:MAG TPA: prepilin peptidase [Clostridiales bacterium]|nr:prepilin peptidase [Clostridiales bacterium]
MNIFTLNFTDISTIIFLAFLIVVGVLLCIAGYKLLNAVPARWLCDYNEEPDEKVLGIRYIYKKSGIITSALFALVLVLSGLVYGFTLYTLFLTAIIYLLLLITMCDWKFTIIPDQLVIALGVFSVGFAIYDLCTGQRFISTWWSPLLGGLCGGGALYLVNVISLLIFRKMGMGFGDVKLMAALGIALGFPNVFWALIAAIVFAFIYVVFLLVYSLFAKGEVSRYFPFGPFLCIGSVCTFIFIEPINQLIAWYINLLTF